MNLEEKKTNLHIRVGPTEKRDFQKACRVKGERQSDVLRTFMRGYAARAGIVKK